MLLVKETKSRDVKKTCPSLKPLEKVKRNPSDLLIYSFERIQVRNLKQFEICYYRKLCFNATLNDRTVYNHTLCDVVK